MDIQLSVLDSILQGHAYEIISSLYSCGPYLTVFLLASLNCSLSYSLRLKIINKTCIKMKHSSLANSRDDKRSFMKFSSGFYIVYFVHFDEVNSEFVGVI